MIDLPIQDANVQVKAEFMRGDKRAAITDYITKSAGAQGCEVVEILHDKAGYRVAFNLERYITDGPVKMVDAFSYRGLYTFERDILALRWAEELTEARLAEESLESLVSDAAEPGQSEDVDSAQASS